MAMSGAVCLFLSACVAPSTNPPAAYARALEAKQAQAKGQAQGQVQAQPQGGILPYFIRDGEGYKPAPKAAPPQPVYAQQVPQAKPQPAYYQQRAEAQDGDDDDAYAPPATTPQRSVTYPPVYPPVQRPVQPVPQPNTPTYSPPPAPAPVYAPRPYTPTPGGKVGYSNPAPELKPQLFDLWKNFRGKTGIAVRRIDGDWSLSERGNELFPQQSVSKFWVAMTIFDKIDKGQVSLDDDVKIGMEDLTLFHQPIRARVLREGTIRVKVRDLLEMSLTKSDCTANDSLLRHAGGPQAVRAFLRAKGINNVRFSEGERHMQSTIAGLTWQQSYSLGNNFEVARSKVPAETRQRLLNNYVQDPMDGASPEAIAQALARLARGELLSQNSTERMLSIMSRTTSGPMRLKAGLPSGWRFLHKTGTGQVYGSMQTGYNDMGIATAPDGTRYAVVVMMGSTFSPIPDRMRMMQSVSRAVANAHVK